MTNRHTNGQRNRQTEKTDTLTNKHRVTDSYAKSYRQTERQTDKQAVGHTDRQTKRQICKELDKQTYRQTDEQQSGFPFSPKMAIFTYKN